MRRHPPQESHRSGSGAENTRLNEPPIELDIGAPDGKLTEEQKGRLTSLLPKAAEVIQNIEDRMAALSVAATSQWQTGKSLLEIDENSAPVMGDDGYKDFLALAEELAEHALFREMALFMGLPVEVVDNVLTQALLGEFVRPIHSTASMKTAAMPFFKRSVNSAPPLDLSR